MGMVDIENTAKAMIETCFKKSETEKKWSLKDITLAVNDKQQYFALQKFFREKVQDYLDKNLVYVD